MSVSQTANTGVSQNTYPEKNLQSYRTKKCNEVLYNIKVAGCKLVVS